MPDFITEKQCDRCIHKDVCAHKKDFEMLHEVVFNDVNVSILKFTDCLESIEILCRFYKSDGIPTVKYKRI